MQERLWKNFSYLVGLASIGVLFGLLIFSANLEIKDLDLWLHLKMGEYIVQHRYVPDVDVLSCSIAGKPWINHEWLFQILVYSINAVAGPDGLITMQALVVGFTFLLLLFLGYSRDRQFGVVFMLLLVMLVYSYRFTIRPDIFSLLFFTGFIYILSMHIDKRWSLYALVFIQILWSNFHGFFFMGPFIVLLGVLSEWMKRYIPLPYEWNEAGRLTGEEFKRLKWLFVFLILACFVNPYTFKGAWYPIGVLLQVPRESKIFFENIQELQRPIQNFNDFFSAQWSFYKLLIFLSFASFIFNRRKIDVASLFLWILFLLFSLIAIRNVVFFAFMAYIIALANCGGMKLEDVLPVRFVDKKFKYMTAVILKLGLIIWMIQFGLELSDRGYYDFDKYERKSEFRGISQRSYPNKAADFLAANHIKGNFFNDFNSGAYLIGRVFPNIRVFIDGRTEVYGGEFFRVYRDVWRGATPEVLTRLIERYKITGAFLNSVSVPIPEGILTYFGKSKDWVPVYFDYDGVIVLKNIPENKAYIDKLRVDFAKKKEDKIDLFRLGSTRVLPYQPVNRAFTLENLGYDDAALEEAYHALKVSPGYGEPYKIIGKIYGKRSDAIKAFENFRIATMIAPEDIESRYNLALAYDKLRQYKYAIKHYSRIIHDSPNQTKAYFFLAKVYAEDKQYDKAFNTLKEAHRRDSGDVLDILKIGELIYDQKEYKRALDVYALGVETKKELPKLHNRRGLCYRALGEEAKAVEEFQKGLALAPEDTEIKKNLKGKK